MIRILGALLILFGCGACGFSMAANHRSLERDLRALIRAIEYMECQLSFQQTQLPELCQQAGAIVSGKMSAFLKELGVHLCSHSYQDAPTCVSALLNEPLGFDASVLEYLTELGSTFGVFDLTGQLQGLRSVRNKCQMQLKDLNLNKENRLRSYQTLGLCAGAALAIILI